MKILHLVAGCACFATKARSARDAMRPPGFRAELPRFGVGHDSEIKEYSRGQP
jgi:hypothetical protein